MTSNRPLDDWGKLLGDVPSATAILDRFLHHAEVIRITGRSYRLRNQSQNPGKKENPAPPGDRSLTPGRESPAEPASEPQSEMVQAGANAAIAPTGSAAKKSARSRHPPTTK